MEELRKMDNQDALTFLQSVYQNEAVPLPVRMRAAAIAIEYERPRLAVTALIDEASFAARLEKAVQRTDRARNGQAIMNGTKLIEAKPEPMRRRI